MWPSQSLTGSTRFATCNAHRRTSGARTAVFYYCYLWLCSTAPHIPICSPLLRSCCRALLFCSAGCSLCGACVRMCCMRAAAGRLHRWLRRQRHIVRCFAAWPLSALGRAGVHRGASSTLLGRAGSLCVVSPAHDAKSQAQYPYQDDRPRVLWVKAMPGHQTPAPAGVSFAVLALGPTVMVCQPVASTRKYSAPALLCSCNSLAGQSDLALRGCHESASFKELIYHRKQCGDGELQL